ncbi:hypothetical protein V1514DRAFT_341876 [Lipomyces japonicus]|uniref:uncharacterized protein n=1 Tax=Lipomyces japonicus TaxID=56871 RepID=UPI0034CDE73B
MRNYMRVLVNSLTTTIIVFLFFVLSFKDRSLSTDSIIKFAPWFDPDSVYLLSADLPSRQSLRFKIRRSVNDGDIVEHEFPDTEVIVPVDDDVDEEEKRKLIQLNFGEEVYDQDAAVKSVFDRAIGQDAQKTNRKRSIPVQAVFVQPNEQHEVVQITDLFDVHILGTQPNDYDIVLSLVVGIVDQPESTGQLILQHDATSEKRMQELNVTILDATQDGNKDFDRLKKVVLDEARLLPVHIVKSQHLLSPSLDFLVLTSCGDDTMLFYNEISNALSLGTRVSCIVRDPTRWKGASELTKSLVRRYVLLGLWSFVPTTLQDQEYIINHFPSLLEVTERQVRMSSRTIITPMMSFMAPVSKEMAYEQNDVTGKNQAVVLGGDFLDNHKHKRQIYKEIIEQYAIDEPQIKAGIVELLGTETVQHDLILSVSKSPSYGFSISSFTSLRMYLDRVASAKLIIPSSTHSPRVAELVAFAAISTGRPIFLENRAAYESLYMRFVPEEMVLFASHHNGDAVSGPLRGLNEFVESTTAYNRALASAIAIRDSTAIQNRLTMSNILGLNQ